MTDLKQIVSKFAIEGKVASVSPLGDGFINDTYKVFVEGTDTPVYILQRKNHIVFPDVPAMMLNIKKVTDCQFLWHIDIYTADAFSTPVSRVNDEIDAILCSVN